MLLELYLCVYVSLFDFDDDHIAIMFCFLFYRVRRPMYYSTVQSNVMMDPEVAFLFIVPIMHQIIYPKMHQISYLVHHLIYPPLLLFIISSQAFI